MKLLLPMLFTLLLSVSCSHMSSKKSCCGGDKAAKSECKDGSCKMDKKSCCSDKKMAKTCQDGNCKLDKSCCKNSCKSCDGKTSCKDGKCHLKKKS